MFFLILKTYFAKTAYYSSLVFYSLFISRVETFGNYTMSLTWGRAKCEDGTVYLQCTVTVILVRDVLQIFIRIEIGNRNA